MEYCQQEKFTARCEEPNDVVLMEYAQYGRVAIGRCVRQDLGYVGCIVNALPTLDAYCSGQPGGCELSIMDPALRNLTPCPTDVTWHLQAAYTCIPGRIRITTECSNGRMLAYSLCALKFIYYKRYTHGTREPKN